MSTIFEAVVCPASEATQAAAESLPQFAVVHRDQALVLIRRAGRADNFLPELLFSVASELSAPTGVAVAAFYDDRVAHREAWLFSGGAATRSFGAADELWVPTDERGEPIATAEPLTFDRLDPGEEYETVRNAIDLALLAAGISVSLDCRQVRQIAFEVG